MENLVDIVTVPLTGVRFLPVRGRDGDGAERDQGEREKRKPSTGHSFILSKVKSERAVTQCIEKRQACSGV